MIARAQTAKQVKYGCGGKAKARKMAKGGIIRGCGAARRGKKFTRNG